MEEWIKFERRTLNKPQLFDIMEACGCSILEARGAVLTFWCWADENCEDAATGMTPTAIDCLIGLKGFTAAMEQAKWCEVRNNRVFILKHDEHNGQSAKKRAADARRQNNYRAKNKGSVTRESQNCHVDSVTESGQQRDLELEREYINKQVGSTTVCDGSGAAAQRSAQPAPTPISGGMEGFEDWVASVAAAHPSTAKSRILAPDVLEAAKEAFMRCPQAKGSALLLKAYFADKLHEDRHGGVFWRRMGQAQYFANLEDIITHAERWDKETGWSRRMAKQAQMPPKQRHEGAERAAESGEGRVATEEEREAFMAALRAELEEGACHAAL